MIDIIEQKLTNRQLKAIPHLVASPTYAEGCQKADINKTTLYKWLKEPEFKRELDRQRDEVAAEAFAVLTQSLTKAVENLVGLIDNEDNRLKRLACKDVIDYILEHKAIEDLVKRIEAIEQRLNETR